LIINYKSLVLSFAALLLLTPALSAQNAGGNNSFSFNAPSVSGFPTGEVQFTGGGVFNLATGLAHSGGSFSCLRSVNQPPLLNCLTGEGVRWDSDSVVSSTGFKCTAASVKRTATTSVGTNAPDTVVLSADFYRARDGNNESFTAKMIVSTLDLDPDTEGIQNIWIEGVGCGTAQVNFNH